MVVFVHRRNLNNAWTDFRPLPPPPRPPSCDSSYVLLLTVKSNLTYMSGKFLNISLCPRFGYKIHSFLIYGVFLESPPPCDCPVLFHQPCSKNEALTLHLGVSSNGLNLGGTDISNCIWKKERGVYPPPLLATWCQNRCTWCVSSVNWWWVILFDFTFLTTFQTPQGMNESFLRRIKYFWFIDLK